MCMHSLSAIFWITSCKIPKLVLRWLIVPHGLHTKSVKIELLVIAKH